MSNADGASPNHAGRISQANKQRMRDDLARILFVFDLLSNPITLSATEDTEKNRVFLVCSLCAL